jgi:Na+/H+ antiporter NhaA
VTAIAALLWANVDTTSYEHVWETSLSIRVGGVGPAHTLRFWVNSGLMTLFFFVVGLEVRREFDVGELRDRKRAVIPIVAGLGGVVAPIGMFLVFNVGRSSVHGWGVTMATDTALAIGMLALVTRGGSDRLRNFMLSVSIADDVVALTVIATVYSEHLHVGALLIGLALFATIALTTLLGVFRCVLCALLGVGAWLALSESGVDPILLGTALGLLTPATMVRRTDLERVSALFRTFREQPTPDLAHSARLSLRETISPNERLQRLWHPWTSYLIVPLFALANAGIALNGGLLRHAITSPIALGILFGGAIGKPLGVIASARIAGRLSQGRLRSPVGWAALTGAGAVSGIGFTVSLLIAGLVFTGADLDDAKVGILATALLSAGVTWVVFRIASRMPDRQRAEALLGTAQYLVDLAEAVDPERDHIRGNADGLVTVVEYGDFQCPSCGRAEPVLRELLREFGEVRFVWRHLPLTDVHPHAQLAAEAAEAAGNQGEFWAMHDRLLEDQGSLARADLVGHALAIGMDVARFLQDLDAHAGSERISEDVDGADLSGVVGTPTLFVDGRRYQGQLDRQDLVDMVQVQQLRQLSTR